MGSLLDFKGYEIPLKSLPKFVYEIKISFERKTCKRERNK